MFSSTAVSKAVVPVHMLIFIVPTWYIRRMQPDEKEESWSGVDVLFAIMVRSTQYTNCS